MSAEAGHLGQYTPEIDACKSYKCTIFWAIFAVEALAVVGDGWARGNSSCCGYRCPERPDAAGQKGHSRGKTGMACLSGCSGHPCPPPRVRLAVDVAGRRPRTYPDRLARAAPH